MSVSSPRTHIAIRFDWRRRLSSARARSTGWWTTSRKRSSRWHRTGRPLRRSHRPKGEGAPSSDVELHALGKRQVAPVIDSAGETTHIGFPGIGAGLATAARFLLAAKGAADLRAGGAGIDVGDAAVRSRNREEFLHLAHVG